MNLARHILFIALGHSTLGVLCQVRSDRPIILSGAGVDQRQVLGLAPSMSSSTAISAEVEASGSHRSATATGTGPWEVSLPSLSGPPSAGTQIVISSPTVATVGAVQLLVNGTGPYPVLVGTAEPFLGENAETTPMLSLVFDGAAFRVLNGVAARVRDCPAGMIAVNRQYCIEPNERDTVSLFEAMRICAQADRRLCSWGEWYGACQAAGVLGLQSMNNNWEYTNDTANENNSVRIVGPSCTQAAAWYVYNEYQRYRCCFTR